MIDWGSHSRVRALLFSIRRHFHAIGCIGWNTCIQDMCMCQYNLYWHTVKINTYINTYTHIALHDTTLKKALTLLYHTLHCESRYGTSIALAAHLRTQGSTTWVSNDHLWPPISPSTHATRLVIPLVIPPSPPFTWTSWESLAIHCQRRRDPLRSPMVNGA